MLPASARVRSRTEHRLVASRGRRARRGPVVVHLLTAPPVGEFSGGERVGTSPRAGVIVGRRVGPAVQRNLVKRRIRHLLAARLPQLPAGSLLVVRALPEAGAASFVALGDALDEALGKLLRRANSSSGAGS